MAPYSSSPALFWAMAEIQRSPYITYAGVAKPQPVPFSHQHHVTGLGIDCRYCHTSVETSSFAGIPPTKTCMNCHSQIWTNAAHARTGARKLPQRQVAGVDPGEPTSRLRLFQSQHSHQQGSGLQHLPRPGRPDAADVPVASLQMEWCLECHRAPEKNLRPRDQVFNMRYEQPTSGKPVEFDGQGVTPISFRSGPTWLRNTNCARVTDITSCSTCHR